MRSPGWNAESSIYPSRALYRGTAVGGARRPAVEAAQFAPAVAACYLRCGQLCAGSANYFDCLTRCVLSCGSGDGGGMGGGDDVACNLDPTACM